MNLCADGRLPNLMIFLKCNKGTFMTNEEIQQKIKTIIVSSLELEDVTENDIDSASPLFGEGLGLDSIDALELGMALKKTFGIEFSKDPAENKKIFKSVKTLADFIEGSMV